MRMMDRARRCRGVIRDDATEQDRRRYEETDRQRDGQTGTERDRGSQSAAGAVAAVAQRAAVMEREIAGDGLESGEGS